MQFPANRYNHLIDARVQSVRTMQKRARQAPNKRHNSFACRTLWNNLPFFRCLPSKIETIIAETNWLTPKQREGAETPWDAREYKTLGNAVPGPARLAGGQSLRSGELHRVMRIT